MGKIQRIKHVLFEGFHLLVSLVLVLPWRWSFGLCRPPHTLSRLHILLLVMGICGGHSVIVRFPQSAFSIAFNTPEHFFPSGTFSLATVTPHPPGFCQVMSLTGRLPFPSDTLDSCPPPGSISQAVGLCSPWVASSALLMLLAKPMSICLQVSALRPECSPGTSGSIGQSETLTSPFPHPSSRDL